jgi:DNA-binding PadR family transcriptional regulator
MSQTSRTSLALGIMSILREHPMHPYEIKLKMHERGHDLVTRIHSGSLYSTIERLHREGLIEVVGTTREGKRPERTTYALTAHGEAEFMSWLREMVAVPGQDRPELGSIAAFLPHLMPWEAAALLRQRLTVLAASVGEVEANLIAQHGANLSRLFRIHAEYASRMQEAEISWLQDLINEIETGTLVWPESIVAWHKRRGTWIDLPADADAHQKPVP